MIQEIAKRNGQEEPILKALFKEEVEEMKKEKDETNIAEYFDNKGIRATEMSQIVIED